MKKKDLQKRMWVPVEKRLPPNDESVVLVWKKNRTPRIAVQYGMIVNHTLKLQDDLPDEHWDKITHWMGIVGPDGNKTTSLSNIEEWRSQTEKSFL